MDINLGELAGFLVRAKVRTCAGNGQEIAIQRPGFKELEYREGDWEYRDSHAGFYAASGQEIVRFQGNPIWCMAYSGKMLPLFYGNIELAQEMFTFLKKALQQVNITAPFRGPAIFAEKNWEYQNNHEGNLTHFLGKEMVLHYNKEIFCQDYLGGLIMSK